MELVRIAMDPTILVFQINGDPETLGLNGGLQVGDDVGEQLPHTAPPSFERLLMRVEPRQAEQIRHEPFHASGVAQDDLEKLLRAEPRLYRGALLPLLARETGGESLRATDTQNLSAVFVDAVSRFNTRYVLSYAPTGVPTSGWHPIEVRVAATGVDVRARRGYVR